MGPFNDYIWEEGIPKGIGTPKSDAISYKIIADPYRKWISIEAYREEQFDHVTYDSKIFDFRSLKPINQIAWHKAPADQEDRCLIRDQDDRVILIEEYSFEDKMCRLCGIRSPHGFPVGTQKILYEELGDPFNGVELYDNNMHLVMFKKYAIDPESNEFGEMLEEHWKQK